MARKKSNPRKSSNSPPQNNENNKTKSEKDNKKKTEKAKVDASPLKNHSVGKNHTTSRNLDKTKQESPHPSEKNNLNEEKISDTKKRSRKQTEPFTPTKEQKQKNLDSAKKVQKKQKLDKKTEEKKRAANLAAGLLNKKDKIQEKNKTEEEEDGDRGEDDLSNRDYISDGGNISDDDNVSDGGNISGEGEISDSVDSNDKGTVGKQYVIKTKNGASYPLPQILIDWGFNIFDVQKAMSESTGELVLKEMIKLLFSNRERANCSLLGRRSLKGPIKPALDVRRVNILKTVVGTHPLCQKDNVLKDFNKIVGMSCVNAVHTKGDGKEQDPLTKKDWYKWLTDHCMNKHSPPDYIK